MSCSVDGPTVGSMEEQLRMLGHERRADLDREARRFALAALVPRKRAARVRLRTWLFGRAAPMGLSLWRGSRRPVEPGSAAAVSRR